MLKILIGSPIYQNPEILKEFLLSLKRLDTEDLDIHYYFVDDNDDKNSKTLLQDFKNELKNVTILDSPYDNKYFCDGFNHKWSSDLIDKVTNFKNKIIEMAIKDDYDYLFLIDSDIIVHPKTLKRLLQTKKDIISNIFWTQWVPNSCELPQVWLKDFYTLYDANGTTPLSNEEVNQKTNEFLEMLKRPGTYKVGGLGACTLISKSALLKGVNFSPVYNISFWGEDRHFCIRAAVLGIELYVDTYYPAYHIYRLDALTGVASYNENIPNRERDILKFILSDLITKAISSANHYSYREELNLNFLKYFTPKKSGELVSELQENRKIVLENKIINNLQIRGLKFDFNENNTIATVKVNCNETRYKNYYSYYKEYEGKCVLVKGSDDNWLIDDWVKDKELSPSFTPIVRKAKIEDNKLTLSMVVKNEASRYLKKVLESAREYIDNAVIIDDGSTDNSIDIIKETLKNIPLTLIENKESKFKNEVELRKQQWNETILTNPDWILFLDADEVFEDSFKDEVKNMMANINVDGYLFRLYDFWNDEYYRSDGLWCAHFTYRLFMIRYQENFNYNFMETALHCGRLPSNCMQLPHINSQLRLKHYGWARQEDRIQKFIRYMTLDPEGKFGSLPQYQSILDPYPNLLKWS